MLNNSKSLHANTTRLSSSKLRQLRHNTRQQLNKPSLRAKRRLLSTFWSRSPKKLTSMLHLKPAQPHPSASQRFTSSNTRHRRNKEAVDSLQEVQLVISLLVLLISLPIHNRHTDHHTRSKPLNKVIIPLLSNILNYCA